MRSPRLLLVNVLVVAVCALIYELLCGTLASYLLGDAVLQFSLVLGTYLFAMGVGAWISKWLEPRAAARYVHVELLLAVVGGLSVPGLLFAVSLHAPLRPLLHGVVFLVGALVGVELPLLIAIVRSGETKDAFGNVVARAFAYDYMGALFASVLFPLVLVPELGLVKTSVLTGLVNAVIAISACFLLKIPHRRLVSAAGLVVIGFLAFAFVRGESWVIGATD